MNIMMILINMIITSFIFAQYFNELDILCDYDGDGEYDCELFLQFGNNNYAKIIL